jgi:hypothetical protein
VGRGFLEAVNPANREYASVLVDREFVAFALDFFSIRELD